MKGDDGMTEKQFEIICENYSLVDMPVYVISDDKLKFDIYGSKKDAERLCTLLNENEQLKQFKNKVFSCIEKAVEETEKYNHSDTSRYYSRKDLLAKLQDGLTGDVE